MEVLTDQNIFKCSEKPEHFLLMMVEEMSRHRQTDAQQHEQDLLPVDVMVFIALKNNDGGDMKKNPAYYRQKHRL